MNFVVCLAAALVFLSAGYMYLNYYEGKEDRADAEKPPLRQLFLSFSKKRAIVFSVSFVVFAVLAAVINFVYRDVEILLLQQVKMVCLLSILVPAALTDYKKHIIPNVLILTGLALRAVFYIFEFIFQRGEFLNILKFDFMGLLIIGGFFLAFALVAKNSIGMGDVKLLMLIALFLGMSAAFSAVFVSLLALFVLSVALLALKKKKKKDSLAFAPSLLIGTYISMALIITN